MSAKISVIMPAYNAATTLKMAVNSIQIQNHDNWEIILVDDGSTDQTAEVAQSLVRADPRIHYYYQDNAGVSGARNTGIEKASGDWIVFIDSDDTIKSDFFSKMLARANDNNADIVICEYVNMNDNLEMDLTTRGGGLPANAVKELVIWPYFTIHAALTKRSIIQKAGVFDTSLRTCEDWDFWLKVFAQGIRSANVNEVLVYYHNTPDSLSKLAASMFADVEEIRRRQKASFYGPEIAKYDMDEGYSVREATQKLYWCVAVDAAQGKDESHVYNALEKIASPFDDDIWLSYCLFQGLMVGACVTPGQVMDIWPIAEQPVKTFLKKIEARIQDKGAADKVLTDLYALMLEHAPLRCPLIAPSYGMLFMKDLWRRPDLLDGVESMSVFATWGSRKFSLKHRPLFMPLTRLRILKILAYEIIQRVTRSRSQKYSVRIARKLIKTALSGLHKIYPQETFLTSMSCAYGANKDQSRKKDLGNVSELNVYKSQNHDYFKEGVWEEIFQTENPWDYDNSYEQVKYQQTLNLLPQKEFDCALELACAEGHFTYSLSERVNTLHATDISETALSRAASRCEEKTNITYRPLDFMNEPLAGKYDLIVCSEVLYYAQDIEHLDRIAKKFAEALHPEGYLLMAHARLIDDNPARSGFDWGGNKLGVERIMARIYAQSDLKQVKVIRTDLYEIHLLKKTKAQEKKKVTPVIKELDFGTPMPAHVAAYTIWGGAYATPAQTQKEEKRPDVPVFMYHRIANDPVEALKPYCISPEDFERQLIYLRRRGYYALDAHKLDPKFGKWDIQGRPVVLSFDDAYVDFLEHAWPIIERNGFQAHIFVPTEYVGQTAMWDKQYGAPAPIMDWDQLRYLARKGVTFGSHLASHRSALKLGSQELLCEAQESKEILEDQLNMPITTIAPPYCQYGLREQFIFDMAGYHNIYGSMESRRSWVGDKIVHRIFPDGTKDLQAFADSLEANLPDPDQFDLTTDFFKKIF